MSLYRFVKRRLNFLGILVVATVFWIFYLILSAPAASDNRYHNGALPVDKDGVIVGPRGDSVTRRVVAQPLQPQDAADFQKKEERQILPPRDEDIHGELLQGPEKQVIPRPPPEETNLVLEHVKPFGDSDQKLAGGIVDMRQAQHSDTNEKADKGEKEPEDKNIEEKTHRDPDRNIVDGKSKTPNVTIVKVPTKKANMTAKTENVTGGPVLKNMKKNVLQLGESFKNKTFGDWEKVKNKTWEKLTDLGVIKKPQYVKLIYSPVKWNLNLSIEDIGNIMKDTQYFKVKQNLTEMEYHPLLSPNSTQKLNLTEAQKYGLGYCDCKDLECMCCVRLYSKTMRINSTACSLITFSSKSQELQFVYSIDKNPLFDRKIAAEFPPKICLESSSKAAGICTLFSNVTAKVNIASESHKLHLSGCMEFDLTLYNRTVSSFPVGCFQIPGKQSKENDESQAQNLGNFMP